MNFGVVITAPHNSTLLELRKDGYNHAKYGLAEVLRLQWWTSSTAPNTEVVQLIRHLLEPVDISKKVLHDAVNLILLRVKTSFEMRIHSREWMSHIFSINLHSVIKIKLRLRFWSGKGDNSHARWGGCAVFFTLLHQLAFRLQGNRVTEVQITAPACKIK